MSRQNSDGKPSKRTPARALRGRVRRDERGLVIVWTSMIIIVLFGFASLAVDIGHGTYVAEKARNAADAAALAGSPYLPGNLSGAQAAAQSVAAANGFTNGVNGVTVTAVQGADPAQLIVTIQKGVPTFFARAIGTKTMNVTKVAWAISDKPSNPVPVDLVIVMDRTDSMSSSDITNVKDAAKGLLLYLKPANVSVAIGLLGPSSTSSRCSSPNSGAYGRADTSATGAWIVAPYPNTTPASNYQNANGTLNTSSQVVRTINCFDKFGRTDLGTPVQAAKNYLNTYGRTGTQRGIILMTDGAANEPNDQSCKWANTQSSAAKTAGITVVTIGFGVGNDTCDDDSSPSPSPYRNAKVTALLADMASPVGGVASDDNLGCTDAENQDGDNFFCEARSADLSNVFILAATAFTQPVPRLIK